MGERPEGCTIERLDGNKGYEPQNCVWATSKEQSRNTSRTILVMVNGKKMCLSEAVELLGLSYQSVRARIDRGWSPQDAITKPGIKAKWKPRKRDQRSRARAVI